MPFTFTHPAIVLPLTKYTGKWLSLTGLVIGSLTPDFEYFLRMKVQSNFSHTLVGAFYFDIPVGLIFTFIFHNLIRNSLYDNLPLKLRSRFVEFKIFNWTNYFKQHWAVVVFSLLLGIISHLLWDSFTHTQGYFVQQIQTLTRPINIIGYSIPLYKILQHFSTIVGGLFIVYILYRMPMLNIQPKKINYKYWSIIAIIIFAILALRVLFGFKGNEFGQLIVTSISATIIALAFVPILTRPEI